MRFRPHPTALLKQCGVKITPILTIIVNLSLANAEVPAVLKQAIVKPLLKKVSLDRDNLKNYRPVSNLSFISKLCEKIVARRMHSYLDSHDLLNPFQSAYRRHHSTETALLRVHNDLVSDIGNKKMAVLLLLDLSSAFDTVDHQILLDRLQNRYGINANALAWFRAYLKDRSRYVSVMGSNSASVMLTTGVPQGSVLGPILFSLYVGPLYDITQLHGIRAHFYADDTQLYIAIDPKLDMSSSLKRVELCLLHIKKWMKRNFLKLNDEKTEMLLIGSRSNLNKCRSLSIKLGVTVIESKSEVKNLGSIFDSELSMDSFISAKCSSAAYYLRCISRIRKFLDIESTKTLIHAFVTSRLDYANGLLISANNSSIARLQVIQNRAARLIVKAQIRDHVTPIQKQLHWLPIDFRIKFKIILMCFNCIHNTAPSYLRELIHIHEPSRRLRSSDKLLLHVPFRKSKFGDKSFEVRAPQLWNSLPVSLRSCQTLTTFKSKLKTFLFRLACA